MRSIAMLAVSAIVLAACGEQPQVLASSKKGRAPAWQGTANAYAAPGWKAGDEQSWERQMQARAQNQNEYLRTGGGH